MSSRLLTCYLSGCVHAVGALPLSVRCSTPFPQRLIEAAEQAKIELSSATETTIRLPAITTTANGTKDVNLTLTRAKFDELCHELIERCKIPMTIVRWGCMRCKSNGTLGQSRRTLGIPGSLEEHTAASVVHAGAAQPCLSAMLCDMWVQHQVHGMKFRLHVSEASVLVA